MNSSKGSWLDGLIIVKEVSVSGCLLDLEAVHIPRIKDKMRMFAKLVARARQAAKQLSFTNLPAFLKPAL